MALEILNITLVYVKSAVAFYVDFYEFIVESMVQFGLWVWRVVSSAPSTVAHKVHEAQEAFRQMVDWAVDWIGWIILLEDSQLIRRNVLSRMNHFLYIVKGI